MDKALIAESDDTMRVARREAESPDATALIHAIDALRLVLIAITTEGTPQ